MENIAKVRFNFILIINDITFNFSYRLKPATHSDKALFGIDLALTDEKNSVLGTIRVGDSIRVVKDEPDFWENK
jgi:hypothetical protein